jgi:hypothetical protein
MVFLVGDGVTLNLEGNITLKGNGGNCVVGVNGTFVMNDGITITGGINDYTSYGGGVGVYGTFIMKGGTISGNSIFIGAEQIKSAQYAAVGKALGNALAATVVNSNNVTRNSNVPAYTSPHPSIPYPRGGGVFVTKNATFTKTGGTITGYADDTENGNRVMDHNKNILNEFGHAVYVNGKTADDAKRKETTAGPDVNLHYSKGEFSGDWDE